MSDIRSRMLRGVMNGIMKVARAHIVPSDRSDPSPADGSPTRQVVVLGDGFPAESNRTRERRKVPT